ncbi:hypothetical protein CNR22_24320 [Sphingobacteriaceae bacterium]|nr:hypothetical protein CNR22_00090 [Sphingobacteriaceae bacterium]PBQ34767.1 hypothetical protein CNR22_24320 [Sphingobacteriaceae bacterium]
MVEKIKGYLQEAIAKYKDGISIDLIIRDLRSKKVPPNYCGIIVAGVLEIDRNEAQKLVYCSESYREYKHASKKHLGNFFDALDTLENT